MSEIGREKFMDGCWEERHKLELEPEPTHKRIIPSSTQNLKILGLWVFFFI